jgi:hypothetical protein
MIRRKRTLPSSGGRAAADEGQGGRTGDAAGGCEAPNGTVDVVLATGASKGGVAVPLEG